MYEGGRSPILLRIFLEYAEAFLRASAFHRFFLPKCRAVPLVELPKNDRLPWELVYFGCPVGARKYKRAFSNPCFQFPSISAAACAALYAAVSSQCDTSDCVVSISFEK